MFTVKFIKNIFLYVEQNHHNYGKNQVYFEASKEIPLQAMGL